MAAQTRLQKLLAERPRLAGLYLVLVSVLPLGFNLVLLRAFSMWYPLLGLMGTVLFVLGLWLAIWGPQRDASRQQKLLSFTITAVAVAFCAALAHRAGFF